MYLNICIDSNAMTYLVEAMTEVRQPVGNVAGEKIALLRIYLHHDGTLYISPTVRAEYEKMQEGVQKHHHHNADKVVLGDTLFADQTNINSRTDEYFALHQEINDCRILAESELGGADVLLTYDMTFLKRLKGKTHKIELFTPSEFWSKLQIPRGSRPAKSPALGNPLAKATWWVW